MNVFQYTFILILLATFTACSGSDQVTDKTSPVENQKVAVANLPSSISTPTTSSSPNIGQRNAAEMVAAGFKRYGTEKGMLIFRMDGALSGTEHLYFDHWGWREGKYVKTEADIGKYDKKENKIQFLDGERRYEYNPATNEAHFFQSRQVQRTADHYGTKDMTVIGDEMIRKMGGEHKGEGEVKGLKCQIWEIEKYKTKIMMWKGITIGERSEPNDIPVARTCILLDTISVIPLNKMTLPEGVKLIGLD